MTTSAKSPAPSSPSRYRFDGAGWYRMTREQRAAERPLRPPWWALPTKNTLDRATATFPKLLHERLDQTGIDFAVLYPTAGLGAPHIREDELRRATCRAFNTFHADIFREYSDRLTPAAVIPMHTPQEAIDEFEYAVKTLGLKVVMMAGHVRRPIPAVERALSHPTRYAYWLDLFAIDSDYDYDPVWAKCIELGVAPSFPFFRHGMGQSRLDLQLHVQSHRAFRRRRRGALQGAVLRRRHAALSRSCAAPFSNAASDGPAACTPT